MSENLVTRIAKMIDTEGAYSEAFSDTEGRCPIPFSTRQKMFQAKYEFQAVEIVKLLMGVDREDMRADLIEFEKDGWRKLGIPIDDPSFKDVVDRAMAAKYADLGSHP